VHLHGDTTFHFEKLEQRVNASDVAKQSMVNGHTTSYVLTPRSLSWIYFMKILHNVEKWLLI